MEMGFYSSAAEVIPVLMLVTVVEKVDRAAFARRDRIAARFTGGRLRLQQDFFFAAAFGLGGEGMALWALARGRDNGWIQFGVIASLVLSAFFVLVFAWLRVEVVAE